MTRGRPDGAENDTPGGDSRRDQRDDACRRVCDRRAHETVPQCERDEHRSRADDSVEDLIHEHERRHPARPAGHADEDHLDDDDRQGEPQHTEHELELRASEQLGHRTRDEEGPARGDRGQRSGQYECQPNGGRRLAA